MTVIELWDRYKNDNQKHNAVERFLVRLRMAYHKNEVVNHFTQWCEHVGIEKQSDLYFYLKIKLLELYD